MHIIISDDETDAPDTTVITISAEVDHTMRRDQATVINIIDDDLDMETIRGWLEKKPLKKRKQAKAQADCDSKRMQSNVLVDTFPKASCPHQPQGLYLNTVFFVHGCGSTQLCMDTALFKSVHKISEYGGPLCHLDIKMTMSTKFANTADTDLAWNMHLYSDLSCCGHQLPQTFCHGLYSGLASDSFTPKPSWHGTLY